MARALKTDTIQSEVINVYRSLGCTVKDTSMVGDGFPDLVIGCLGHNDLVEVKSGEKKRKALTPDQKKFHCGWRGKITIICSIEDAIQHVKRLRSGSECQTVHLGSSWKSSCKQKQGKPC